MIVQRHDFLSPTQPFVEQTKLYTLSRKKSGNMDAVCSLCKVVHYFPHLSSLSFITGKAKGRVKDLQDLAQKVT